MWRRKGRGRKAEGLTSDVDNVSGGALVSHLLLIKLAIKQQLLVIIAERPPLMRVGSTIVVSP
jgi:hypothetical protein